MRTGEVASGAPRGPATPRDFPGSGELAPDQIEKPGSEKGGECTVKPEVPGPAVTGVDSDRGGPGPEGFSRGDPPGDPEVGLGKLLERFERLEGGS